MLLGYCVSSDFTVDKTVPKLLVDTDAVLNKAEPLTILDDNILYDCHDCDVLLYHSKPLKAVAESKL